MKKIIRSIQARFFALAFERIGHDILRYAILMGSVGDGGGDSFAAGRSCRLLD
jgi:hypothetical protein